MPLAVCDVQTNIDLEDVVAADHVSPSVLTELAYFRWNAAHRWYWLSNQRTDEVLLMTQYDTHPPGGKFNGTFLFRSWLLFVDVLCLY